MTGSCRIHGPASSLRSAPTFTDLAGLEPSPHSTSIKGSSSIALPGHLRHYLARPELLPLQSPYPHNNSECYLLVTTDLFCTNNVTGLRVLDLLSLVTDEPQPPLPYCFCILKNTPFLLSMIASCPLSLRITDFTSGFLLRVKRPDLPEPYCP